MTLRGLAGKAAVVTGAGQGIGRAVVERLMHEGCRVLAVDIESQSVEALPDELGPTVVPLAADVSEQQSWEKIRATALTQLGRIDCLHNNAGIGGPVGPMEELGIESWDRTVAVNLTSVFLGLRMAFRQFSDQKSGGAIVNQSSLAGLQGMASITPYVATKFGVVGLTKAAALEGAPRAIRVNAVAPGQILTPMFEAFASVSGDDEPSEELAAAAALIPARRLGSAAEVADLVAWLLSDESIYVTGDAIAVDGGLAAGRGAGATK